MKKYCIIVLTLLFGANCLHAQADSTFWERITTLIGPSVDCFSATDDGIIALSGKTGVSAIYLSTDGAATWRATSVKGSVKAVYAASADNLLAVVDESIYHSSDTGKTWRSIPIGWKPILNRNDFKVSLRNVYSPAPNTLIAFVAITHNRDTNSFTTTIWYSKNLGVSWDSVASLSLSTHRIRYFKKNNILLVCGAKKHNISYSAYKGAIAASRDNGRTWKMMTDTLNEYTAVSDIIALSSSVLLAACSDNGLYRSEDAGKTWYRVPSLEKASVECIEINEHGTIFVGSNERIYTSTDTGKTWIGHPINNDTIGISMIQCTKRSVLLTTTAGIYRDTAFPSVFSREYDSIVVDNIRSVAFGRYGTIMAGFLGGSAVSDDTGKTWRNTSSHDVWQKATCITSKGTLLLYSSASREPRVKEHTLRSTDNGATWHEVYGIKSNGNTYPIYPDCFLAVGDTIFAGEGGILRSTDDGQTWRAMQGGSAMCLYRTRAGTYLAGDERAISRSTDGGATFKPTDINTTLTSFIFFTDIVQNPKTGRLFAASTGFCNFGIYYSDDDGEIWIPHTQWLDRCTQKLAVDSIGNIYATSWYDIFRSTDNGATWQLFTSSGLAANIGNSYGGLSGGSPYSAFIVSPDGRLYLGMQDGGLYRSRERFPPVSVAEQPAMPDDASLQIIPNPASESFRVAYSGDGTVTVRDVLGRVLLSGAADDTFSTAGLAAGAYSVEVYPDNKSKRLSAIMMLRR